MKNRCTKALAIIAAFTLAMCTSLWICNTAFAYEEDTSIPLPIWEEEVEEDYRD